MHCLLLLLKAMRDRCRVGLLEPVTRVVHELRCRGGRCLEGLQLRDVVLDEVAEGGLGLLIDDWVPEIVDGGTLVASHDWARAAGRGVVSNHLVDHHGDVGRVGGWGYDHRRDGSGEQG